MDSFFFYDLETTGRDPRWHRIMQFGGVRTDAQLQPLGPPVSWDVRLDDDVVPEPEACLVTGLSPDRVADGIDEGELFRRILAEFSQPRTCVAGYNSLRFDDEFVRYGLWRNLQDPYAREWQHGNSRWDLIDLARMAAALRPEGLTWPTHADGRPSFRLEDLAAANGIEQQRAHDATSDVMATVGLARLLQQAQPRLFDYFLGLRDKARAAAILGQPLQQALVHVSVRYSADSQRVAVVAPVAWHPVNRNAMIVVDLSEDLTLLEDASPEALAAAIFTPAAERDPATPRVPLQEVQINKVPAVAPLAVLGEAEQERLGIDLEHCLQALEHLRTVSGLGERVAAAWNQRPPRAEVDADAALYSGFLPNEDRRLLADLAAAPAAGQLPALQDGRARELAWRYLARRHPQQLSPELQADWQALVRERLTHGCGDAMGSVSEVLTRIDALRAETASDAPSQQVLAGLEAHLRSLAGRYGVALP